MDVPLFSPVESAPGQGNRGCESSISYQLAFEPTQPCFCFCSVSGVSSVPRAIEIHWENELFESDQNNEDPQLEQNWRRTPSEDA